MLGRAPAPQGVVADTHLVDQPHPLQRVHTAHDRPVADQRIRLVHLVEIEAVGPKPVRAGHSPLLNHRGDRHQRENLRRQEHRLPVLAKRLAQDPLAAPETVDLGGVEERDPQLECAADDRVRDLLGVLVAVSPVPGPELPGAQPDLGNLPGGADVQITHGSSV